MGIRDGLFRMWLDSQQGVYVEKSIGSEYVHSNTFSEAVSTHPKLKTIQHPSLTLVAIYILTGSDYISTFFRTSKQTFVKAFIDNIHHICPKNIFVEVQSCCVSGLEGAQLRKINLDAWTRLVCCVYLLKHKTLYNSEQISSLYITLTNTPLHEDKVQLLKWLAYKDVSPIKSIVQWHDFTRRVCFRHSSGSKDHECLLIPSLGALKYHMLRPEYVIKTIFSYCHQPELNVSGCKIEGDKIQVLWDEEETIKRVVVGKGCGCKSKKCDGSTAGCRSCYRMCKPCSVKCECKGLCNNPHNNGGKCPKCAVVEESESSDEEDNTNENNDNSEVIPQVPPDQHGEIDTDSDMSDDDE